jgi:hypothetical protein
LTECQFGIASTLVDLPVSLGMESHLKEPVLGVVTFAASWADQIAAPSGTVAVIIFGDGEGRAAAAGDEEHAQGSVDG